MRPPSLSILANRPQVIAWLQTAKPVKARLSKLARQHVADFRAMCRAIADEPADTKVMTLLLELDRLCIEPEIEKILRRRR